jgi:type 1 glutamine amidotransferase
MTPSRRHLLGLAVAAGFALTGSARADDAPKRLLLVTHSGGFIHKSVVDAERVLKKIGPANGLDVTCYRFTGDPDAKVKGKGGETTALEAYSQKFRAATGQPVEKSQCGRVNAETLKNFDAVLFFTTGDPLTKAELGDLEAWVKAGGAFTGTHCATDTLYGLTSYGDLIGAYFKTHPGGLRKVTLKVEDPNFPAAKPFVGTETYTDEIYVFRDAPYSRENLHIILSAAPGFIPEKEKNKERTDGDYAISWCKNYGKGRVFYTAFGHADKVWEDPKFQQHLIAGIKWAMAMVPGDATPTGAKK